MSSELSLPVIVFFLCVLAVLTVLFIASTVKAFVTRRFSRVIIAAASGTAATGLLGFLCLQAVDTSAPGTPDSQVFLSKAGICGLSAPASWAEIPFGPEASTLRVGSVAKKEFLTLISEPKSDFDENFTLRNYAASANLVIAENLTNVKETGLSEFSLNGLAAIRSQINGERDGTTVEYLVTCAEGKNHFHQIRCWTTREARETAFPVLRKVANSFYELPEPVSE